MARYKDSDLHQSKLIPINLAEQITPGSFEHTISLLVDEHIDMSIFDARYDNDEHGRPAYDPAMLLRVILAAYARGFTSSRQIERLCRENVVFMALSGDSQPHFTTIANFIRQMDDVIQSIFTQVLMVCNDQGLIGGEMFAIDGCKLPSNASRSWSGTHAQLHVRRDSGEAKFWLNPVRVAYSHGFKASELRNIRSIIDENREKLIEAWNEFFSK